MTLADRGRRAVGDFEKPGFIGAIITVAPRPAARNGIEHGMTMVAILFPDISLFIRKERIAREKPVEIVNRADGKHAVGHGRKDVARDGGALRRDPAFPGHEAFGDDRRDDFRQAVTDRRRMRALARRHQRPEPDGDGLCRIVLAFEYPFGLFGWQFSGMECIR